MRYVYNLKSSKIPIPTQHTLSLFLSLSGVCVGGGGSSMLPYVLFLTGSGSDVAQFCLYSGLHLVHLQAYVDVQRAVH